MNPSERPAGTGCDLMARSYCVLRESWKDALQGIREHFAHRTPLPRQEEMSTRRRPVARIHPTPCHMANLDVTRNCATHHYRLLIDPSNPDPLHLAQAHIVVAPARKVR